MKILKPLPLTLLALFFIGLTAQWLDLNPNASLLSIVAVLCWNGILTIVVGIVANIIGYFISHI